MKITIDTSKRAGVYTQAVLSAAFDMVADKQHWKNPIDATIPDIFGQEDIIRAAVIHFTGSIPTFKRDGKGNVRVQAKGYYLTIGA